MPWDNVDRFQDGQAPLANRRSSQEAREVLDGDLAVSTCYYQAAGLQRRGGEREHENVPLGFKLCWVWFFMVTTTGESYVCYSGLSWHSVTYP